MAGDWIKFEANTPDKPEVVKIAAALGIDQDAVVGKLLRVWVWADQNSIISNGGCNGVTVTAAFLDRLTFCPGFTEAMRSVGWLIGEDGNLSLPNFERHNGKTAKERAVSNRRVSKHRVGNGESNADGVTDVTAPPLQKPLPEKRREEKEKNPPNPPADAEGRHTAAELKIRKATRIQQIAEEAQSAYNGTLAKPVGLLPACTVLNKPRLKAVEKALPTVRQLCHRLFGNERVTPQFWKLYFETAADDDFHAGRQKGGAGHENWTPDFEYLLRETVIAKLADRALSEAAA